MFTRYSFERIVDVVRVVFVLQMEPSSGNLEASLVSYRGSVRVCLDVATKVRPSDRPTVRPTVRLISFYIYLLN